MRMHPFSHARSSTDLLILTCLLMMLSCAGSSPAESKAAPRHSLRVRLKAPLKHQVVVADQLVMVVDAAAGDKTATERVDMINDRLVEIISTEALIPGRMRLEVAHGQTVIMVGRHLLTSVTPADARANHTTVPVLAHFWLANLKRILPQARPASALP